MTKGPMIMKTRRSEPGYPGITDISSKIENHELALRWRWPSGVHAVYIAKQSDELPVPAEPDQSQLRLFTRDEYKAAGYYRDRLEGIGRVVYTVYPSVLEQDGPVLILQQDSGNQIAVSAGKAKIMYSVQHKKAWFRDRKSVQIKVTAEVPVPREVLCYVKKMGGYPLDKEDGTVYPFTQSFMAGPNILPSIEVRADEYVRLFFTEGATYGQTYELIPE